MGRPKRMYSPKETTVLQMLERGIMDSTILSGYSGLSPGLCGVIRAKYRRMNNMPVYQPIKYTFPARCKTCHYKGSLCGTAGEYFCDYIGKENKMRGCPGGDECIRYLSRKEARKRGKI